MSEYPPSDKSVSDSNYNENLSPYNIVALVLALCSYILLNLVTFPIPSSYIISM